MAEKTSKTGGEVVINVPDKGEGAASHSTDTDRKLPSPNNEGLARRKSFSRSVYSKPNSRFEKQHSFRFDESIVEENVGASRVGAAALNEVDEEETDENEEIYEKVKLHRVKRSGIKLRALLELAVFFAILCTLVVSLTIDKVNKHLIWGLEIWKWCVFVMVTLSGMFMTNWFMHLAVFIIERNYLLRKKVLYFVHGLKKNVQVFIWFSLVLVSWIFLFEEDDKHSRKTKKILDLITWTIVSLLVGSILFLVKTFALKVLASKFNVRNFFERIQESVFHQYVLQTLSGPPLVEEAERVGSKPKRGHLSFMSTEDGSLKGKKVLDMGKVHKMKQEKVSALAMRVLIEAVRASGLSTISNTLDECINRKGKTDKEITNEMEAVAAAYDIFNNVAQPNRNYINEDDLLRFMIKQEVDLLLPLIEGAETGKITRKAFTEWVIKVFTSRKALGHSLDDTKTAVKQVDKLIAGILTIITFIIWLILLDIASTKFLLVFSSQFVGLAFMIGSTCKNIFESFVFVFVMHPYDVGDRCVVDGVMLLVEEIHLLTTVFLKIDNEKVFYPNAVLITKSISNFYRSPDMGDFIELSIAFSTPAAKIATFKKRIGEYLVQNPHNWYPEPLLMVKAIENVNKLKMNVLVQHTINFQNFAEKNIRRTELFIAIKRVLEELEIDYTLLPQDVHLTGHK
ncbi:Mechanosensitive ion channel protein 9 [Raphanus sativus]|uniref:Mechanosensitive ion channel protein n=1 Tax=Raphanus sativus TaxID=3726 RepID=A0A9W3CK31_RAPSA|nr:mechanosensitive ion channel protein 9-like [Raphanus sativus]KAJ4873685.1 Mechanosensitive ion channel protein 9 [Raphanus sativus]